jgi:DNA-binding PadR family transcriptional regulator
VNKNELIILGLLNEKPSYGYQLKNIIHKRNLDRCGFNKPSIYSTLNKLEREGKIVSKTEQHGNMPLSKIYSLTEKGKEALKRDVEEAFDTGRVPINPAILGIIFIFGTSKERALTILKENLKKFEHYKKVAKNKKDEMLDKSLPFNWQFLFDFESDLRPILEKRLKELIKKIEKTNSSFFYPTNSLLSYQKEIKSEGERDAQ